jgi:hypothetical protein
MNKKDTHKKTNGRGVSSGVQTNSPLNSLLTLEAKHSRSIAVSAGGFRSSVLQEVGRILNEHPGNQLKAARVGTKRLLESKFITAQEAKEIDRICKVVFAAQRGKVSPDAASDELRGIHARMLKNTAASPVALAVSSIASSGPLQTPSDDQGLPNKAVLAISQGNKVDLGLVGGVLGGAVIGGAIGGFGGAIIGAVVGGIAGGIAGACA